MYTDMEKISTHIIEREKQGAEQYAQYAIICEYIYKHPEQETDYSGHLQKLEAGRRGNRFTCP